jgi:hypothetical protein
MISGNEVGMSPSKQGERGCEGIGMKVTGNWSSGKGEYRRDKQILEVSQTQSLWRKVVDSLKGGSGDVGIIELELYILA